MHSFPINYCNWGFNFTLAPSHSLPILEDHVRLAGLFYMSLVSTIITFTIRIHPRQKLGMLRKLKEITVAGGRSDLGSFTKYQKKKMLEVKTVGKIKGETLSTS